MRPRFARLDDRTGVEILDPIESNRFVLYTPEAVSPAPADTAAFPYPVSVARQFVASAVTLPYKVPAAVRDADDGSHLLDAGYDGTFELDADGYLLEVSAPVKLYLRVDSSLDVDATAEGVTFAFDGRTRVAVGARSLHTSPAATVTVPDDPAAAMAAVSTFGSALKTTTCERSWPNLRGHPPRVERGDELSDPDGLAAPDTGVTLRVPADYEHVWAVAPLAYYLGAEVVAGDPPRLTTDTGFVHRFDAEREFEDEVVRVLRQVFLLDCVTRTEGFHPMDLAERRAVESAVNLAFADLYGAPLGEQLAAYLSVPRSALADAMPPWNRVTYVRPTAESVELLPFVANDLSLVRTKSPVSESPPADAERRGRERDALSAFKRRPRPGDSTGGDGEDSGDGNGEDNGDGNGEDRGYGNGEDDRNDRDAPTTDRTERATGIPDSSEYVPLPEVDAMERAWVGDGTPVHGAKLLAPAFERDRSTPTDGVIDVTVVCNDEEMREEWDTVSEVYGRRDVVPFDVDCRFDVSTEHLRSLLTEDHDLFHFVGHIDGRGFECRDGIFDAATLSETGATTLLLNACRSHDQGVALVEAGARAAIVSWSDVDNLGAVEVGETFARLLNYGFAAGSALELVEEYTAIGRHYVVVGDPSATVAQCEDGNPLVYELQRDATTSPASGEAVATGVVSYTTPDSPMGAAAQPHLQSRDDPDFYLVPGPLQTFTSSRAEVEKILGTYSAPVVADGELRWSDELFGGDWAGASE